MFDILHSARGFKTIQVYLIRYIFLKKLPLKAYKLNF